MNSPVEPWADSLKVLMLVFGGLLLAAFAVPWAFSPKVVFSFTGFSNLPTYGKMIPLLMAGTGALAIILSFLPLATAARGGIAAALGLGALLYLLLGAGIPIKMTWRPLVELLGGVILVAGLLVRSEYRGAVLARILITLGAAIVLAMHLIPDHSVIALVEEFKAIGNAPGKYKVEAIVGVVPLIVAVLALIAWLPSPSAAGALIFAWTLISWPLVEALTKMLIAGHIPETLKAGLGPTLLVPMAMIGWIGLACYGAATTGRA